jgi:hypothetical protein
MSRAGFELQDMISRLGGNHSWETLENLQSMFSHPEKRKLAEEEKAMKEAAQLRFRQDLLATFSTEQGRNVLEELIAGTVGRPPINLGMAGLSSDQVGVMSAYREGQNAIIHSILSDLEKAGFNPSDKPVKGDTAPCSFSDTTGQPSHLKQKTEPAPAQTPETPKAELPKKKATTRKRPSTARTGSMKPSTAKQTTKPSTN